MILPGKNHLRGLYMIEEVRHNIIIIIFIPCLISAQHVKIKHQQLSSFSWIPFYDIRYEFRGPLVWYLYPSFMVITLQGNCFGVEWFWKSSNLVIRLHKVMESCEKCLICSQHPGLHHGPSKHYHKIVLSLHNWYERWKL